MSGFIIRMKRGRQLRWAAVGLPLALCSVHIRAAPSEDFSAVIASAPAQIHSLRCEDVITAGSGDPVVNALREWLARTISPVTEAGISNDRLYGQLVQECAQEPGRRVLDVVLELHAVLGGRPSR